MHIIVQSYCYYDSCKLIIFRSIFGNLPKIVRDVKITYVFKGVSYFYAPDLKIPPGHLVIRLSVRLFVFLSVWLFVIPSFFLTKCNI